MLVSYSLEFLKSLLLELSLQALGNFFSRNMEFITGMKYKI